MRVPRDSLYDSLDSDEEGEAYESDWAGRAGRQAGTEQGYHSEPSVQRGLSKVGGGAGWLCCLW